MSFWISIICVQVNNGLYEDHMDNPKRKKNEPLKNNHSSKDGKLRNHVVALRRDLGFVCPLEAMAGRVTLRSASSEILSYWVTKNQLLPFA